MLRALLFGFAQAIPFWLNDAPIIRCCRRSSSA